jgi:threonine dehydrogenase-like Zn-dependent dehydrogenase
MKALVITGAAQAEVWDVDTPSAGPGEVVVDVKRAGICGTDIELFTGEMQYLHTGHAQYPLRIGHEWMGVVSAVGEGVDPRWLGTRVTGDTSLGCGACHRCRAGYQHVCEFRYELGVRGGRPGALAEKVAVPVAALHALPDTVTDAAGALVEPGGNSFRSVAAADPKPGERVLIFGTGTIALLCAMFARARGANVHLMGRSEKSRAFARSLGFDEVWEEARLPALQWDAIIDASNAPHLPAKAIQLVEPGKRVVLIGISGTPSMIDTRDLVLADVTAVGLLSGSPVFADTISSYANGSVDPTPLVAATVALEELPQVLAGRLPTSAGQGPKIHVTI